MSAYHIAENCQGMTLNNRARVIGKELAKILAKEYGEYS